MALRTSEFETDSEKRAQRETRRWLAEEPAAEVEIHYLLGVISARTASCHASVAYLATLAALAIALSVLWGTLMFAETTSGWVLDVVRVLFGATTIGGLLILILTAMADRDADAWTLLQIRVMARQLDIARDSATTGRGIRGVCGWRPGRGRSTWRRKVSAS